MDMREKSEIRPRSMPWADRRIGKCHNTTPKPPRSISSHTTLEERTLGYVALEVKGDHFYVHCSVLSNISPVFEAMFRHNFKESLSGKVDLSDSFSSIKQLLEFIDFMYGESIDLNPDNVIAFLDASVSYFISRLTKLCSQYLFKQLRPSNCLEIWLVASLYSLNELKTVCQHLFSAVFSFVKIQKSIVIGLPNWFIEVLWQSSLPETHPNCFARLLIVWLLGGVDQRKSTICAIVAALGIPMTTLFTALKSLRATASDQLLVMSLFRRRFALPDRVNTNPPKRFKSSNRKDRNVSPWEVFSYQNHVKQYLCVMLLNQNNLAAFYCMAHKQWRTRLLPAYNGIVLGIISGNMLVRVVPKGSSANLFNLQTGKSIQTRCVLSALAECNMDIAFLPVQSNFFLALGCLHVALIVRKFRSFQLTIFRYENRSNRWCFRMSFPLFRYLGQVCIRVYSTQLDLVYLIVTEKTCSPNRSSDPAELSHLFVVDLFTRKVIGSSCGYFRDITENDCFILMGRLHFVNNLHGFFAKKSQCIPTHVIDVRSNSIIQIYIYTCAPQPEHPPITSVGRENPVGSEILSAIKENTLCLFYHMHPYLSAMFTFDMEFRKWTRTPPLPPIFKESPSKLMLVYTCQPVSTLLPDTHPDVIFQDSDLFREYKLK